MLFPKTKDALNLYARFGREHCRSPLAPAALLYAGTLCAGPRMNDFAKAREWFARIAVGHPGTREAVAAEFYTATLAWRGRKWTEAEKLHKAFAANHPGSPLARVALDERLPAIAKKTLAVPLQTKPIEVVVGPRDRKRRAIPIEQPDFYDNYLYIKPASGYKLVGSAIVDQNSRRTGEPPLWTGPEWEGNAQRYHLANAFSSQEYVMVDGTITKPGPGGGGGAGQPPPFRVTVPSVDVDWVGFADENNKNDEPGEETRFVIVPLNTNRVDDIRGVKLNDPFDDERNLRPNFPYGHPVNPDITLHWEAGNELGLARGDNAVKNGTNINARTTDWPLDFTVIPKLPTLACKIYARGQIDDYGEKAIDTIHGRVVNVDLDIDANYDGKIDELDEPLEEKQGGLACVCTNNLTPIKLTLQPAQLPGKLTLSATMGGHRIRLWRDAGRTIEVPLATGVVWNASAAIPGTLYVEGITNSATARDVELRLEYDENPQGQSNPLFKCADVVRLTILKVDLTEAKGLYTSNGTYQVGYTSTDNIGRVYCNSAYDSANPSSNSWNKNKQYVDFTVEVIPTNAVLPSDARIVWEAEDPDDPSNEAVDVNNAAKEVLDPNDSDSVDNDGDGTADNSDEEDNTGGRDGASEWEEISADYALSGNETKIKDGISIVRFNVTDDGGDNFIVKAKLQLSAGATPCEGDQAGVMTIWKKINIESVTMSTADALPVNDIPDRFTKAFVEFHIALSRSVSDGIVDNGTPPINQWVMGLTEGSAYAACQDYVTVTSGEFSHEGPEWFFVSSAHEFIPLTSLTSEVLYPPSGTASNAIAIGTTITLPIAIATGKVPDVVYIYNASLSSNVLFSVKAGTLSVDRKTFEIEKKDYHEVDSPSVSFLDADLTDYGFPTGSTVNVRVKSPGSYGVGGISPGLAGKTIVFTGWVSAANSLGTLVHELTHAFGLAHKCGNWDFKTTTPSTSCTMNYGTWFILDDGAPRAPVSWTDKRTAPNLCAPHIKAIRESNLEDLPGLGW